MKIINLTPHEVTILGGDGSLLAAIAPSGQVARVSATPRVIGGNMLLVEGQSESVGPVPTIVQEFGPVVGLPDEQDSVGLLVSAMVRAACPGRRDLYSPAEFVRDGAGKIVGCKALEVNP